MKTVNQMLIFDVDGVITDPKEKRVTEPQILYEIIKRLEREEPAALNTGRSIEWLKDRVLNPLIKKMKDKKILQNLFAVGEKGGVWAEFDKKENLVENIDKNISIPDNLKNKIRDLINNKYSDSMFYDESKFTMISVEMNDGYSLEDYKKKQNMLFEDLKIQFSDKNLIGKFKIDPSTIAIDIENVFVGKHFSIKRIIEWVKKKGFKPLKYIAFGDSFKSDIPMAKKLNSQKLPVEFVYVGEENIDISKHPFPIRQTEGKYEKGTLEFLKEHES